MKLDEKGMTLIELMVSMLILAIVVTATLQFYDTYYYEKNQLGEYTTAKHLAVKAIEEQRDVFIQGQNTAFGVVHENIVRVNGINFVVTVNKEDETASAAYFTDDVPFVHLTANVKWRMRKVEVSTYVSAR